MRALGKGSIASFLAAGLHVARVVIFAVFAGLSIAVLIVPALTLLSAAGGDDAEWEDAFRVLYYFVTFGILLYIVNRLLEILRTLRFGSPFVKENAIRFRKVGLALALGEGAKIFIAFVAFIADAELDAEFDLTAWVGIAAVFVLAEVFHEGAKMKEEQDLTV